MPVDVTHGRDKNKIPFIRLSYSPESTMSEAPDLSPESLVEEYQELKSDAETRSVMLLMKAEVVPSSVIRALYNLYRAVSANDGLLVCVGYPPDYKDMLTSLGLLDLPGFLLASSEEEAVARIERARKKTQKVH